MASIRWDTEENKFLMEHAYRLSWKAIAAKLGRTEAACKAHYKKIKSLRESTGTWKGI
jgi:hypothetical protein